jgi:hypothetical protein
MGAHFAEITGTHAFSIDQLLTVQWPDGHQNVPIDDTLRRALFSLGGTGGLLRTEVPCVRPWMGHDAYVLSLDNAME